MPGRGTSARPRVRASRRARSVWKDLHIGSQCRLLSCNRGECASNGDGRSSVWPSHWTTGDAPVSKLQVIGHPVDWAGDAVPCTHQARWSHPTDLSRMIALSVVGKSVVIARNWPAIAWNYRSSMGVLRCRSDTRAGESSTVHMTVTHTADTCSNGRNNGCISSYSRKSSGSRNGQLALIRFYGAFPASWRGGLVERVNSP